MQTINQKGDAEFDFPGPTPTSLDMHWKVYEVKSNKTGGAKDIVAVGIRESGSVNGQMIDIYVVNQSSLEPRHRPYIMDGKGWTPDSVRVKLTPGDVLILPKAMRGRGIGYLVFNEAISWAKRVHRPDTEVMPITLVRSARTEDPDWELEYTKLTAFYGAFGFEWQVPPVETDSRHFPSNKLTVRELKARRESELGLIRPVYVPAMISRLKAMRQIIENHEKRIGRLSANVAEQKTLLMRKGRIRAICCLSLGAIVGIIAGRQL